MITVKPQWFLKLHVHLINDKKFSLMFQLPFCLFRIFFFSSGRILHSNKLSMVTVSETKTSNIT